MQYDLPPRQVWLGILSTGLLTICVLPACQRSQAELGAGSQQASDAGQTTREIWESFYLQNAKIGYGQSTIHPADKAGLVQTDSLTHVVIVRFGERTEQELKTTTWETPEGALRKFKAQVTFGPTPLEVEGYLEGPRMVIVTRSKGSVNRAAIAWAKETGGFRAIEQSLEVRPLQPGETRDLKMLMPVINQVADVKLVAKDYELTSVLGTDAKLLRVESIARLPGDREMTTTLWIDAAGAAVKTRMEAMQQESFRTSRELAVAEQPGGARFDLGTDVTVKLGKPLAGAHRLKSVTYRVELTAGDPSKVFSKGPTQSVRSLGPHTAEITVISLRPADVSSAKIRPTALAAEYLQANSTLQIDDPRVRAMAEQGRGDARSPAAIALALEKYVYNSMAKKNFSHAFATAAEMAESREGDCTEHAVLLAALARVCEIPSRVAIGLVYVDSVQGFGYHMWSEVFLDGQWIPLDATLGDGGIGAAHLKLADSSLEGAAAYSTFLPVAQVVGQLKIGVLAAESRDHSGK